MVHELINQKIDVLVAFTQKNVVPLYFKWSNRRYKVDKVNMIHENFEGKNKFYFFSVTSQNNFFKLSFNTNKNKWKLEEAYYGD